MKIAFDVDGTLIHANTDLPRHNIISILHGFAEIRGVQVYVWSGGGKLYAEMIGRRLNLPENVTYLTKDAGYGMDICFDDQDVKLADKNIKV